MLESSATWGHNAVQVSSRLEGGLMSDLAESTDWIGLGDNFCAVMGDSQLAHFQDCSVQAAPKDSLKIYVVMSSRERSLRAKIAQCISVRARLKEGFLVERFSGKIANCERE